MSGVRLAPTQPQSFTYDRRLRRGIAILTALACVLGLGLWPAVATATETVDLGPAQILPGSGELVGWGRGANTVSVTEAAAANLPDRVTTLLGYNPFDLRTTVGTQTVQRGAQPDLSTAAAGPGVYTVILSLPAQPALEDRLTAAGAEVIQPLSVNSYAVRATAATAAALANDSTVYWVGRMPADLKVDPAATTARTAVVGVYDPADSAAVVAAMEAAGLGIVNDARANGSITCTGLDAATALALANMPEVCAVAPVPDVHIHLETSAGYSGNHQLVRANQTARYSESVVVGMIDSGWQSDHVMYAADGPYPAVNAVGTVVTGQPTNWFEDNPSGHGSHVSGIVLGRAQSLGMLGMAPWTAGGPGLEFRVVRGGLDPPYPPGTNETSLVNLDVAMQTIVNDNASQVINNSWGGAGNTGTDDIAALADTHVWNNRQIWVFSAGNSGATPGTIGTPGAAKNVIAVGSVNNDGTNQLSSFSSEGPTFDGRAKPDIYAPGSFITSTDATNLTGFVDMQGTSMAAPHITGILATLVDHISAMDRRPELAKAALIAASTPHASLQPHTGVVNSLQTHYGTAESTLFLGWSAADVPPTAGGASWDLDGLPSNVSGMYVVLTWIEPPATVGAPAAVLNDIDLEVDAGKDGTVDYSSLSFNDNVEAVFIPTPAAGNYRFRATRATASTSYRPALAIYLLTTPAGPEIPWLEGPPAAAVGGEPIDLLWELAAFGGPITQHQAHFGIRSVLGSSAVLPGANGVFFMNEFNAPNVGTFDSPETYAYIIRALDNGVQHLSVPLFTEVTAGPAPPHVEWITAPPASAPSGGSFPTEWRLTDYDTPVTTNAVGWGVTSIVGQTADQPGGNGTYSTTVNVPVVGGSGTLYYTAFASNPIEFAFAPIQAVTITVP